MASVPNIFALGQDAYKDTYSTQQQIGNDRTKIQAGRQLATGDYTGAASTLNANGQIDAAHNVIADHQVLQDRSAAADGRAKAEQAAEGQRRADGLLRVVDAVQSAPVGSRLAKLQQLTGVMQSLGIDPKSLGAATEADLSDDNLASFRALVGKAAQDYTIGNVRYAGGTNKPLAGFAEFDPNKTVYAVGDAPAGGPAPAPAPAQAAVPAPTPAPMPAGGVDPQMVWKSIIQQESGGKPGVTGPQTQYGQAQGETQLLPQTAQAMAQKTGVPWRPDLMTATTPEGAAYQEKLGQAYFQEGLQKYGGDVQKAAMYYYGGPDEKLWGPKTHAYAQQVLARAGQSGQDVMQGGAGPDTVPPPPPPAQIAGFHVVSQARPQWQDMPNGQQRNIITGKVEGTPTAEDDAPLSPEAVKLLAGKYLNNGTLPPMGMGKTGTRNRVLVLNEATNQAKALGLDANDLVAGTVTGKAAAQALNKATGIRSLVESSERTVLANAKYALSLANQGGSGPSHIPVLNRWIQAGRKNIAGDAQVAQFDQAIRTVAEEYAKVMTTTTGSGGVSSDSARQEAYRRLDSAGTNEQLKSVIDSMQVEMDNRASSLRDTEAGLRSVIRSGGQPGGLGSTPDAPDAPAAPPPYNPAPPPKRPPLAAIFK